jgi:hypothetical protein
MGVKVTVKNMFTADEIAESVRAVTLSFGQFVRNELSNQKPPPPRGAKMHIKSERQRRFLMAAIRSGQIVVPYRRGSAKGSGSEFLNQSYSMTLRGDVAYLESSASYARYVVGSEQAAIHSGRWETAENAAERLINRGDLELIVMQVMGRFS